MLEKRFPISDTWSLALLFSVEIENKVISEQRKVGGELVSRGEQGRL